MLIALLLLAALTGCGRSNPEPSPTPIPTITPAPTAAPTPEPAYAVWADRDNVNIRSGPSENSELLDTVPFGTRLEALGRASSDWTRISWISETGEAFVLTANIAPEQRQYWPLPDGVHLIGVINQSKVNARSGPTLNYPPAELNGQKLREIQQGTEFTVIGFTKNFVRVQHPDGIYCWLANGVKKDKKAIDVIDIIAFTTDDVNLREGPSAESGLATKLSTGTKLHICGYQDGFYKVNLDKPIGSIKSGWVSVDYVVQAL